MTNRDDFLRDKDGKIITDRLGRPVRRGGGASATPSQPAEDHSTRILNPDPQRARPRQTAPGQSPPERPRQYFPPKQEQYTPRRPPELPPRQSQVAPPPPPAPRRRKARMRRPGCLRGCGLGFAAILVLLIASTLWLDTKLNRIEALPEQRISNTAGTNWLLVGSDSRQGLSEEDVQRLGTGGDIGSTRTDTIMLLHIPRSGQATLVSLPRDSYVNIPGYGMDKINASFTYGGPQLLTQTVEEATGLRVDHYAEIGMGGLANVVDAVNGIEVCPQEPIHDDLANLHIEAGCQTIDGPTALGYVRTRATAMGDLDRVQRQREFFSALINKTTSGSTLANPFRIMPTINSVAGSFTVDNGDHIWDLARVGLAMRGGLKTETVPIGGFADYDVGNVVLWDEAGAAGLFDSMR